jgi:hypothetical protein
VALAPRPIPQPLSFEAPPQGPAPLSGFWLGVAAAALALASVVAAFCREIAARWRGIVVAHLFFLTLWMAIQVFFFATGAFWCLPNNSSKVVEYLTRSFGTVARCGPLAPSMPAAFQSSAAVAAPAPAPPPPVLAPPRPPAELAAAPRAPSPDPSPDPSLGPVLGPSFGLSSGALPPPAAGAPLAPGWPPGWSARTITNCWRNRAVDSGDCYQTSYPRRRPPPPPPSRYRYSDQPPPASRCRHPYDCWPAAVSRHDL